MSWVDRGPPQAPCRTHSSSTRLPPVTEPLQEPFTRVGPARDSLIGPLRTVRVSFTGVPPGPNGSRNTRPAGDGRGRGRIATGGTGKTTSNSGWDDPDWTRSARPSCHRSPRSEIEVRSRRPRKVCGQRGLTGTGGRALSRRRGDLTRPEATLSLRDSVTSVSSAAVTSLQSAVRTPPSSWTRTDPSPRPSTRGPLRFRTPGPSTEVDVFLLGSTTDHHPPRDTPPKGVVESVPLLPRSVVAPVLGPGPQVSRTTVRNSSGDRKDPRPPTVGTTIPSLPGPPRTCGVG